MKNVILIGRYRYKWIETCILYNVFEYLLLCKNIGRWYIKIAFLLWASQWFHRISSSNGGLLIPSKSCTIIANTNFPPGLVYYFITFWLHLFFYFFRNRLMSLDLFRNAYKKELNLYSKYKFTRPIKIKLSYFQIKLCIFRTKYYYFYFYY